MSNNKFRQFTYFAMFLNWLVVTLFLYLLMNLFIALIAQISFLDAMHHKMHTVFAILFYWWPGVIRVKDMYEANKQAEEFRQKALKALDLVRERLKEPGPTNLAAKKPEPGVEIPET